MLVLLEVIVLLVGHSLNDEKSQKETSEGKIDLSDAWAREEDEIRWRGDEPEDDVLHGGYEGQVEDEEHKWVHLGSEDRPAVILLMLEEVSIPVMNSRCG